ncbi:MAG TPA: class I SAM-dependent methyltransferase [Solirubrobacterales bacterium]
MADLAELKQQQRAMWAMGDYPSIAERIATAGTTAVDAAAVSENDAVLDVACGSGNATIPAARTGAEVTGLDLTPELLEAGRVNAAEAGVKIDWVEGDAEQLPFDDASFDVVISVFGCMFAPDHRKAAEEIARVLRPGGRIAVCAWTPDGSIGRFFALTASHMPPPPEGFQPPVLWGSEDHVRELFDGTGIELELERAAVELIADSADEFMAEYERDLPPMVAARALLEPQGKWEALHDDVRELYDEVNVADDGSFRQIAEYLVTKGTKR